ncbi:winged helix-turn-helix transcriptional regulator [Halobacillus litoralis]|uniref:carbohydrate kinase n=1 Tax=Halobacillus litoralis TaxID=45668 RepID=UPI001CD1A722|nr:carbohydrate kinase [Halobacillus litoralis]MCA0972196.1 winged helix-turn-helix transcriptional regulator [Halobacillus litoralis]
MNAENLTNRERDVYERIVKNPYISQQQLSDELGLSRSTVANLISTLVQKNVLLGRAYVLNQSRNIVCIGGANVDRKFHCIEEMQLETSNPVHSSYSAGGVARNVAENLGRLGFQPSLITAAGHDADWDVIESASSHWIDLEGVMHVPYGTTGTYTAILDDKGNMNVGFADMQIFDAIIPKLIDQNEKKLRQAECIIADFNCPKETLAHLLQKAKRDETPVAFITVSAPKMKHLPEDVGGLTWLMTNAEESASFFNKEIETEDQWSEAVERWLSMGVEHVTMTWGDRGVMVGSRKEGIRLFRTTPVQEVKDVTGAGDAFSAAVIHGWLEGLGIEHAVEAGLKSASLCIQSSSTVLPELSSQLLNQ